MATSLTLATPAMVVTTSQLVLWATLVLATTRVAATRVAAANLVVESRATSQVLLSTKPSTTRATPDMAVTASTLGQAITMAGTQRQVCASHTCQVLFWGGSHTSLAHCLLWVRNGYVMLHMPRHTGTCHNCVHSERWQNSAVLSISLYSECIVAAYCVA